MDKANKVPKIVELVWSKAKAYTVKKYKGNKDCQCYVEVDDVFNLIESTVSAERERCAKIVEKYQFKGEPEYQKEFKDWVNLSKILARAIREENNAK